MMGQGINVGGIYADLEINSSNLERGLANARKALNAVESELKQLKSEFDRNAITVADYTARVSALSQTQSELQQRMQQAYAATRTLNTGLEILNQNAKQMTNSVARMGQGMMQLGYIADDLQYGFSGVVNNIAPLVYGLSGSAGVSAAAQVAAVGVYQLYVNWDRLMEAMGTGKVLTESEQMEALAKATSRTAEETDKLNRYKREQAEIEAMKLRRPDAEVKQGKGVENAIANGDVDKIYKGVFETLRATGRGAKLTPAEIEEASVAAQAEREKAAGWFGTDNSTPEEKAASLAKKVADTESERDATKTRELMRGAAHDPSKLKELMTLVDSNPGAFQPGTLKDLSDQLPENIKQQEEWERQGAYRAKAIPEAMKERDRAKKEMADAQKAEADDLAKKRKEDEAADKEGMKQDTSFAHRIVPGLDERTQFELARAMLSGGSRSDVIKKVSGVLQEGNAEGEQLNKESADRVAKATVDAQEKKLNETMGRKGLHGREETSFSQVYGSSSLTERIQGAISNTGEAKKHTSQFDQMIGQLTRLANNTFLITTD